MPIDADHLLLSLVVRFRDVVGVLVAYDTAWPNLLWLSNRRDAVESLSTSAANRGQLAAAIVRRSTRRSMMFDTNAWQVATACSFAPSASKARA